MPSNMILSPLLRHLNKIKQFRTAQLHIQNRNLSKKSVEVERTSNARQEGMLHLPSIWRQRKSRRALPASMTIEAALVLPLFTVAICFLMMPIVIMDAQTRVQYQMEQAAELASGAACLKLQLSSSGKNAAEENAAEENAEDAAGAGNIQSAAVRRKAGNAVEAADTGSTEDTGLTGKIADYLECAPECIISLAYVTTQYPVEILGIPGTYKWEMATDEDPMIEMKIISPTNFPLSVFLGENWGKSRLVAVRRAWVGREGGAGKAWLEEEKTTKETAEEAEDPIVYVARKAVTSKRYHVSASCHYISNKMTAVSCSELSDMRTTDGRKYHACSVCKPKANGTVYIFPTSDTYHASTACSAIQSFAVEMKRSQAEAKGYSPCSYCGKK